MKIHSALRTIYFIVCSIIASLALPAFVLAATAPQSSITSPAQISILSVVDAVSGRIITPPSTALFYPNEVQLTVDEQLSIEPLPGNAQGFILALPRNANRDTFSIKVDGAPTSGYYWLNLEEDLAVVDKSFQDSARPMAAPMQAKRVSSEAQVPVYIEQAGKNNPYTPFLSTLPVLPPATPILPEREKDPARRALLQNIVTIQEDMERTAGEIATAEARMQLWQQPLAKGDSTPDARQKIDETVSNLLPQLLASSQKLRRIYQDTSRLLADANKRLSEYDAAHRVQLVVVPFTGGAKKNHNLTYTYILPGSCQTQYSLGAFPSDNKLTIEQHALLQQYSGIAWSKVEVLISTTRRNTRLDPLAIAGWYIRLLEKETRANRSQNKMMYAEESSVDMMEMRAAPPMASPAISPEPVQEEKGTFRLWSLGKKDIAPSVPVSVQLSSEEYKAEYYYTLRPSRQPQGFLTAGLNLDKALELPEGQARFFIDGIAVGNRSFTLNGNKATIFFGSDPQVSGNIIRLANIKGEEGFISKKNNATMQWKIDVANTRNRAVTVFVEEPRPVPTDTNIKLVVVSTPKPIEANLMPEEGNTFIYQWKFDLQAGEQRSISHKIELSAPADRQLVY